MTSKLKKFIVSKALTISLLITFGLGVNYAQENDDALQKSKRFDQICQLLQDEKLTINERAALLYEKSYIMLTTFRPGALRSGTEAILEAIMLNPNNEKYTTFLKDVYIRFWKNRDLSGNDEISISLKGLRGRVKKAVGDEAQDIRTNGYWWLDYSNEEKVLYVDFISKKFNIDNNKHPIKKMIATLDHYYELATHNKQGKNLDALLVLPCTVALSGFIDVLKEEAEKYRKQ